MDKKSILFYLGGGLLVISMFNLLQAESKKNTNPYSSWVSCFKRIGHQQDMRKFGFEIMGKDEQKAMRQVLHAMGVKNAEKIPLKKFDKRVIDKGVSTLTGIWIDSSLPDSKACYIRHREAKKYWEKNEKKYWEKKEDNFELLPSWFISAFMGIASVCFTMNTQKIATSVPVTLAVFFGCMDLIERKNQKIIKKIQRRVLSSLEYKDLAADV